MLDLPEKDLVVEQIYENYDSTEFIKNLYKSIKENNGEEELYKYFSEVYEELFANLLLKKTFVSNNTRKILETLALPIYKKEELEKKNFYNKIEKL